MDSLWLGLIICGILVMIGLFLSFRRSYREKSLKQEEEVTKFNQEEIVVPKKEIEPLGYDLGSMIGGLVALTVLGTVGAAIWRASFESVQVAFNATQTLGDNTFPPLLSGFSLALIAFPVLMIVVLISKLFDGGGRK